MTDPEVTPGGSRVIRHGERRSPEFKTSERSTLENIRKREAAYTAIFGPPVLTYDDVHPVLVPHIDVYVYEPGFQGRDFYTLVREQEGRGFCITAPHHEEPAPLHQEC